MQQSPEFSPKNPRETFLKPNNCEELLEAFEQKERLPLGEKLRFEGIDNKDVYNITAPFKVKNETYIAGRVESRSTNQDAHTLFFVEKDGVWQPDRDLPTFKLEDPFLTKINGEIIFGGVQTYPMSNIADTGGLGYRTIFYRGENLQNLRQFSTGPDLMKDIRLIELPEKKIGVFTRSQGKIGGRGKIGFIILNSLEELTADNILKAKLIEGQFYEGEWGGVSELHALENGNIGALGHIANKDESGGKHYFAMTFLFNPEAFKSSSIEIIAARKNFPKGETKKPDLEDVVFPGGLIKNPDQTATLYTGLSDAEAGRINLPNPFFAK